MKFSRQYTSIMTIDTLLKMFHSDRVILKTFTGDGQPITYKNNKHEQIPDDIKRASISKYSAYYNTICGELYTIIDVDIIWYD